MSTVHTVYRSCILALELDPAALLGSRPTYNQTLNNWPNLLKFDRFDVTDFLKINTVHIKISIIHLKFNKKLKSVRSIFLNF
jgi:hypothetical protein